jgi:hypothetical protein
MALLVCHTLDLIQAVIQELITKIEKNLAHRQGAKFELLHFEEWFIEMNLLCRSMLRIL